MAYSSWSVVFSEQPSAAKWNILGTNDASFNDGTGIFGLYKNLLTVDSNPYKFGVYRAAAFNVGNGTLAKITMDTELYDTNNNFATGTYTTPVAGFYHFDWGVGCGASGYVLSSLFKNGSEVRRGMEISQAGATDIQNPGSADLQLSANDTIEVYAQGGASLAGQVGQNRTFLNGHLVSRT